MIETTVAGQAATTDPARAEFTAALRALADFLDANPSLPLPHRVNITVHPQGTDEEERDAVDLVARILDVQPETSRSGHYRVERDFGGGRVAYGAVAIPAATMAQHAALMSYRCAVSP